MKYTPILLFAVAGLLNNGCGGDTRPTATSTGQQGDTSGTFSITDRTGKTWDVTHAFEEYSFNPQSFQYGLGPFAITPLNERNRNSQLLKYP